MTRPGTTHIVGAGLAGLAAAVRLASADRPVVLYEAGPHAGGRCRSYFDETLGCRIDNGNHLLLSGNRSAMSYLETIGAGDSLVGPDGALFPFLDVATGERWTIAPNGGPIPFWLLDPGRRVPGTSVRDYLGALRLATAGPDATVAGLLGDRPALFRRFWEPLAVSALNTEAAQGAARLLWPVLRETFGRGARFCRPLVPRDGLSESFVDPALAYLRRRQATIQVGCRVRSIGFIDDRAASLDLGGVTIRLRAGDTLVVATPPAVATGLVPGLVAPTEFRAIVNAHFRIPGHFNPEPMTFIGLIGGTAEWVFHRRDLASVTVSAATALVEEDAEAIAPKLWSDVARALKLPDETCPAYRIVKEKRATFAQTPEQIRRRPNSRTQWHNLFLAGDWTDTKLPATIEGAVRSGDTAAACVLDTAQAQRT